MSFTLRKEGVGFVTTHGGWPRFTGRSDFLRVSASDAQGLPHGCGLHGSLKVRHQLKAADWQPRRDESQPCGP